MPNYVYEHCNCNADELRQFDLDHPDAEKHDTFELAVPISRRDDVRCLECDQPLKRRIAFTGLTWAPTAGGMR